MAQALNRLLDIVFSAAGLIVLSPVMAVVFLLVRLDSPGPAIFAQTRVGRDRRTFTCYKFRTMVVSAPNAPSHEVSPDVVRPLGRVLRRLKLDELPQLWNVLRGEMSLVGPRPCLPTQTELIEARDRRGLYAIRPGITGPAQVNHIDMADPERLARADEAWLVRPSTLTYVQLLILTVLGRGMGDRVRNA